MTHRIDMSNEGKRSRRYSGEWYIVHSESGVRVQSDYTEATAFKNCNILNDHEEREERGRPYRVERLSRSATFEPTTCNHCRASLSPELPIGMVQVTVAFPSRLSPDHTETFTSRLYSDGLLRDAELALYEGDLVDVTCLRCGGSILEQRK